MDAAPIGTDYLVVGAGAAAMAFVDTLLDESDATVVMVDRHDRPGGHWNDAYPFVRLHQPAEWYGVASRELGSGQRESAGFNAGLYGLASGPAVVGYYDAVMRERFLPSGRVRWLPMTECRTDRDGLQVAQPLLGGSARPIVARTIVDATHARTEVPSTHPPRYQVDPGVRCAALNDLPRLAHEFRRFTVVGSGKTGIDACLWLLENGVEPSAIRWIMPRDAWLYDRANVQPGIEYFERFMRNSIAQFEAIASSRDEAELFGQLEARGVLMRIDPAVAPTTFRCGTVSRAELDALRRIGDVVRLGRVLRIEPSRIVLQHGEAPAAPDALYVDCSAGAIQPPPDVPVFDGNRINLLMVRFCQPTFSAALIAYVASHFDDPDERNALCAPVPSPELPSDWLRMWAATLVNMARWRQDPALGRWLSACRLNMNAVVMRPVRPDDAERIALGREAAAKAGAAGANLSRLVATLAGAPQPR